MIPLVGHVNELKNQRQVVDEIGKEVAKECGVQIEYRVGTMIEVPRGALTADQIAEVAEFFSFGTNDLTQMVYGISRDDAGKFLPPYLTDKDLGARSLQPVGSDRCGRTDGNCREERTRGESEPQDRHLRGARWGTVIG